MLKKPFATLNQTVRDSSFSVQTRYRIDLNDAKFSIPTSEMDDTNACGRAALSKRSRASLGKRGFDRP